MVRLRGTPLVIRVPRPGSSDPLFGRTVGGRIVSADHPRCEACLAVVTRGRVVDSRARFRRARFRRPRPPSDWPGRATQRISNQPELPERTAGPLDRGRHVHIRHPRLFEPPQLRARLGHAQSPDFHWERAWNRNQDLPSEPDTRHLRLRLLRASDDHERHLPSHGSLTHHTGETGRRCGQSKLSMGTLGSIASRFGARCVPYSFQAFEARRSSTARALGTTPPLLVRCGPRR